MDQNAAEPKDPRSSARHPEGDPNVILSEAKDPGDSSGAPLPQNDGTAAQNDLTRHPERSEAQPSEVEGSLSRHPEGDFTRHPEERSDEGSQAAAKARAKRRRKQKNAIADFFIKLAIVVVALWAVFTFVLGLYRMDGQSMYPSLRDGDLVLTWRIGKDFVVGDVLTYEIDGRRHTARVVAQEGDVVELSGDGYLIVNGNIEAEETFYETAEIAGGVSYPYTVPEDSYFLLGDNRTSAIDSRSYGAIAAEDIDGKVITILRRRGI